MEDRGFEELIEELRELKIREAELTVRIERAKLARAQRTTATAADHAPPDGTFFTNGFRQGDRVRITNKVRKPATSGPAWTEAKERLATVTKVIPDQVHSILTDNGTRTWRAPNNLKRVLDSR